MKKQINSHDGLKRVLIINSDGNAFNNPSLKCIIDLFLENGYKIDLRYPKSRAPTPSYPGIRFLPYGNLLKAIKLFVIDGLYFWTLIYLSVYIEKFVHYKDYDLLIGVDRRGLIEASVLNKITGTPYIFISFEIMFACETSLRYKQVEKNAAQKVSAWLVQDRIRAEQVQIENDLDPANKILLPLASAEIGKTGHNRLRDSLGIPIEKKVAIMIGTLAGWTMADQVLENVSKWPENWVLIIHHRYGNTYKSLRDSLGSLSPLLGKKIFISDAATQTVDEMGDVLSGVNVGLAFYQPDFSFRYTGKNVEYLGLSSGKISTYLRYGIPVMVNKIGLYADEIALHRLGIVIGHPSQISDKLNDLCDLDFSDNARNYFLNSLDFNLYRDAIWNKLSSIMINSFQS
ncbi:glycosyl transferase family 2 [Methyloglobulus morosus KoM1]|uniref:Glycosyl transferase family 2 n=1 Tax=Methyloglobulus morosus KoM1 TaxID=1116472 RepID=V5BGT9_9GAMM|nr:glycosyl transferase family 2 [Methyloglobulus morosus]ESS66969.1 glycosyl transferase family 2 [Methyloglobulus morosus KoM1]